MRRKTTKGQCFLCNGTFSKSGMTRHLQSCTAKYAAAVKEGPAGDKGKTRDCLLLQVEGRRLSQYWLFLEVPVAATLAELDLFLRNIWLECCGHMSMFNIHHESYGHPPSDVFDDRDMYVPLAKVVETGEYFTYEYDFGSTTELTLKLLGKSNRCLTGKKIAVLARNYEPQYRCSYCEKIAVEICTDCIWGDEGWLCEACAEEHECSEEMLLPVVNSPRVGVCAYMGDSE